MVDWSTTDYQYDVFGRRIKKTVTNRDGQRTQTEFIWQGDTLIAERSDAHGYQSYIYEPESFRPMILLQGEGLEARPYHYHLDAIGTPIKITSDTGRIEWSTQYWAYGRTPRLGNYFYNPLRFQGQYFDEPLTNPRAFTTIAIVTTTPTPTAT